MAQHKMRVIAALVLGMASLAMRGEDPASLGSDVYGKSRFRDIPVFAINRPVQIDAFNLERRHYRDCGIGGVFQIAGYYTRSTTGNVDEQARAVYFLPNGRSNIIVSEQGSNDYLNFNQDVYAQYFKVATAALNNAGNQTYSALLQFVPVTEVAGIGLEYVQSLGRCWWFDLTMPVQYCSTNLGIIETQRQAGNAGGVVTAPTGWYPTVMASWASGDLRYGRFLPAADGSVALPSGMHANGQKLSRWGVGDLDVRLGYQALDNECVYATGYVGFVAPTARKYNPTFLWDPQLGYAHWGAMWGSSLNFFVREFRNGGELRWMLNINNRYLFQNNQLRSLDIKGKVWSRYMQVWLSNAALANNLPQTIAADTQPLINFSTLQCKVRPRASVDINTSFVYNHCWFQAELGFNAYARHAEELILNDTIQSGVGLADVDDVALVLANGPWTIDQFGYIRGYIRPTNGAIPDLNNVGVQTYVPVTNADLDLNTASAPGVLAYSVYGSLGVNKTDSCFPWFAHVGGLFTFASDNTVVERWGVFAKIGMSI